MIQRRKVIVGTLSAAAAVATIGGSAPGSASAETTAEAGREKREEKASVPAAPVRLSVTPASGATAVSPASPVVVKVENGALREVAVTAGGTKIDGSVQADGTWRSDDALAYGKTYKVVATATDGSGASTVKVSGFTTVKPQHLIETTFRANAMSPLKKGQKYGAGQPVIIAFSHPVADKAAAEKAIDIATAPAVEGKFYWASSQIVHWRPAKYWAKGTTIKVNVNVLGVNLGKGVYGARNASTHFTIGRQLIAINDTKTHRVKVYIDGKLARDMACSNGRGGYTTGANGQSIHFWTQAGPHVVLNKERWHSMSSASYGLSDPSNPYYYAPEDVQYCTRITYSGEFLHAAPWNHSLGRANLSHGCVNLGVSDARWVFENFLLGDVAEVKHSPKPLPMWDGLGDWMVSFDKYGH